MQRTSFKVSMANNTAILAGSTFHRFYFLYQNNEVLMIIFSTVKHKQPNTMYHCPYKLRKLVSKDEMSVITYQTVKKL